MGQNFGHRIGNLMAPSDFMPSDWLSDSSDFILSLNMVSSSSWTSWKRLGASDSDAFSHASSN